MASGEQYNNARRRGRLVEHYMASISTGTNGVKNGYNRRYITGTNSYLGTNSYPGTITIITKGNNKVRKDVIKSDTSSCITGANKLGGCSGKNKRRRRNLEEEEEDLEGTIV